MRQYWPFGGVLLTVALLSGLMVGCAGKKTEDYDYEGGGDPKASGGAQLTPMKAEGKATLKGKVTYNGDPPNPPDLTITKDPSECTDKKNYSWVIDGSRGVKNVFVWIRPANKDEFFDMEAAKDTSRESIKLDQPACAFKPHCFLLYTGYRNKAKPRTFTPTGQDLIVTNEMSIAHNASVEGPLGFKANPLIPPKNEGVPIAKIAPNMNTPYKVGCTVHPWMTGWFWALEHPYAAVTNPDGSFEIKDIPVPKDGKMRVVVWHEEKRWALDGKEMGEEIELKPGDSKSKDFSISK